MSLESVRNFAKEILAKDVPIQVLANNGEINLLPLVIRETEQVKRETELT